MSPDQILAIFDGVTDPRNKDKLTRLDYANANAALVALAQYFQAVQRQLEPASPPAQVP